MNIFFLYLSAKLAARCQCDSHVIKMILESTQLLSGAVQILLDLKDSKLYKVTHGNHPCAIWVRSSKANFNWLIEHALELCYEYTKRYHRVHKSQAVIEYIKETYTCIEFPSETFFVPPMCMPEEYKISKDVTLSYREYYKKGKVSITEWNHSDVPDWW